MECRYSSASRDAALSCIQAVRGERCFLSVRLYQGTQCGEVRPWQNHSPVGGALMALPCRLTGVTAWAGGGAAVTAEDSGVEEGSGAEVPVTASMAAWSNRKGRSTCTGGCIRETTMKWGNAGWGSGPATAWRLRLGSAHAATWGLAAPSAS